MSPTASAKSTAKNAAKKSVSKKSVSKKSSKSGVESRKPTSSGDETRARIRAATLATLKSEGIGGTSARAIAKEGDFNQALIFYHYGSINELIVAAVDELSTQRMERHRVLLEQADTLTDFIAIARELHKADAQDGSMTVFVQAFAGASGDPEMGPKLFDSAQPWTQLIAESVERVVGERVADQLGDAAPFGQIGTAIGSLFVGIELFDNLDPSRGSADELFDMLSPLAELLDKLLASPLGEHLGTLL